MRAVGVAQGGPGGDAGCLGVGSPQLGAHPRPTTRLWGVWPGPATHCLWVRGIWALGPVTNPTARTLVYWLGALLGRHEGAREGTFLAWVRGVLGWMLTHTRSPFLGACGRGPLPTGCECGGCWRGEPSSTPQRALMRACFARCGGFFGFFFWNFFGIVLTFFGIFVNKCHQPFKFTLSNFAEQRLPSRGVVMHGGSVHEFLNTHAIVAADKDGDQVMMSLKTYLMEQNDNMGVVHKNGDPVCRKPGDFTPNQELMWTDQAKVWRREVAITAITLLNSHNVDKPLIELLQNFFERSLPSKMPIF